MTAKPIIWIIDTSVFLNILDVPGFNQNRDTILQAFRTRIAARDTFLLPFTSIIEAGNHIAHIVSGNQRRRFAGTFVEQVTQSINGSAPWKPLAFPNPPDLSQWLQDFPNRAQQRIGLGDHMIIKQWEEQCRLFQAYLVKIWSLDVDHLQGYECNH